MENNGLAGTPQNVLARHEERMLERLPRQPQGRWTKTAGDQVRSWLGGGGFAGARLPRAVIFGLWLAADFACPSALADQPSPPSVLVLNQANAYRPWPNAIISEIRRIMADRPGGPVAVYVEDLDLYRFKRPDYLELTKKYLSEKYRDKPIGLIMPIGSATLNYALRMRALYWPSVPIVFSAVDQKTAELDVLPGITGLTIQLTLADMINAARYALPDTERFAIVGDQLEHQPNYGRIAEEVREFSKKFQFINLMGLPLSDVRRRVANLPEHTVVLYIGINSVASQVYAPADLVPRITEVANRPVIVSTEPYFGSGAIGGYIVSPTEVGRETGLLALRVINGEDASSIPVTTGGSLKPIFDWRQLQRWNIKESNLPPGSEIRFRPPSVLEQYWWEIVAVFGIVLIQTGMLFGLIIERHRRHTAEEEAHRRAMQVIHLNRTATAGALSASVAHELNQPLGAILNYAETADLLLSDSAPNLPLLKEIIADIRRDDQRASEVIKHLRGLLKERSEADLRTFDLNEAIHAAIRILEPEAVRRSIALDAVNASRPFPVHADQVQLQQVILNLVTNGMDAVSESADGQRRLMLQAVPDGGSEVEVMVSDSGPGIPEDKLKQIFDPFYTTKANGTGLGLAIARTIVEAHGGAIRAENRKGGGAVFRFTLPLDKSTFASRGISMAEEM